MSWNIDEAGQCVVKTLLGFKIRKRPLRFARNSLELQNYIHKPVFHYDHALRSLSPK